MAKIAKPVEIPSNKQLVSRSQRFKEGALDFVSQSYARHAETYSSCVSGSENAAWAQNWLRQDTIGHWRQSRLGYSIARLFGNQKVLTVGDGRYGLDAIQLQRNGAKSVLPTDISPDLLRESKKLGWIEDYKEVNAESIPFGDGAFDFVFTKEALHHFPRPYTAINEMLRVAKKGVVVIEPRDDHASIYFRLKKLLRRRSEPVSMVGEYEPEGNFVYNFALRDFAKVALALNLPWLAVRQMNDLYIKGIETATTKSPLFFKYRFKLGVLGLMKVLRIKNDNMIMVLLSKVELSQPELDILRSIGWKPYKLPRNPYIGAHKG